MDLTYRMVAADSGAMGGSTSAEFQVLAESGEDAIVACDTCDYAANVEVAVVRPPAASTDDATVMEPERIATPGKKTIEEVSTFLKVKPESMLKSLVYVGGETTALVVIRGDHEVNEIAVARALGVADVFLASDVDVKKATGTDIGFVGPIGFKGRVLVDRAASQVKNGIAGGNERDVHVKNVNRGRDYDGDVGDFRMAGTGDGCAKCGKGTLTSYKGIEAGHIFILGTHYTAKMGATFLAEDQQKQPIIMGCYGIGVSRLVAATVEQHHDQDGMRWPMSIAPYHVHICTIGKDDAVNQAAKALYDDLESRGVEVLWDDRDERPGVKFKDADLLGIPLRVTIGGKGLAAGNFELKPRSEPDPKKAEMVPVADAARVLEERVKSALAGKK